MEDNNYNIRKKKIIRKAGRTIVLRTEKEFTPENLLGLLSHNKVNNEKHFLVFDTIDNAKVSFKTLKNDLKLSVRFAYYRLFFKMNGIDEKTDYTQIKTLKYQHKIC